MLVSLARILILVYLGYGAYLYFAQRHFMYFPVAELQTDRTASEIISSNNEKIKTWSVNPDNRKAVIYFGGNAENVLYNATDLQQALPEHSIYLVNYRGYGGSSGSPSQQALFADALNIFDTLQARHQQISVIGRSLGSSVSLYLASQRPVDKMILVTPFDSAVAVAQQAFPIYPVRLLLKDKYESIHYAAKTSAPALLLIAENDNVIPHRHSLKLAEAFNEQQATTVFISNSGHNNLSGSPDYWQAIGSFLNQ